MPSTATALTDWLSTIASCVAAAAATAPLLGRAYKKTLFADSNQ